MARRKNIIRKTFLLSLVLAVASLFVQAGSVLAGNVNINMEVCSEANAEPVVRLSHQTNATVFDNPLVLGIGLDWAYGVEISRGGIVLASPTTTFALNQNLTQNLNLNVGASNFRLVITGGCPRHTIERNVVIHYQPYGASINSITTSNNSPALAGRIATGNYNINVIINGQTYPAINHGDGTWTLPAGTISPALSDGTYDVVLQVLNETTNAVLGTTNATGAVTIAGGVPTVTIDRVVTNNPSSALSGHISSPTSRIEVEINGQTYPAINHGDGTWTLPVGTISPALTDGNYTITVRAFNPSTNALQSSATLDPGLTVDTIVPSLTIDTTETDNRQPEITGTTNDPTAIVMIEINGHIYTAINHGDGTWTLPTGTISPLASGNYDLIIRATDRAGNVATEQLNFTVKAKNEIEFVLPPHTGYMRINRINIPSWLIYLVMLGLVWLVVVLRRRQKSRREGLTV